MSHHRIVIRGLAGLALAGFTLAAQAECGGQQQCMAVSIDPAVAPAHGTPETSAPLAFGGVASGATSTSRPILVGAVTGPAGTLATLNSVSIAGSHPTDFEIVSQTCVVGVPSLLADGPTCTLNVAFRPTAVGARSAELKVSTSAITRTVPLTGTGTTPLPTATSAALTVKAGSPATLDLSNNIGGPTGETLVVAVSAPPQQGTVTVNGTRVTYTPTGAFVGADSFAYTVAASSGTSSPATVSVSVVARADPAADSAVTGALRAQAQTAQRFARTQLSNVQTRLGALRRLPSTASTLGSTPRLSGVGHTGLPDMPGQGLLLARAPTDLPRESRTDVEIGTSDSATLTPWLLHLAQAAQTGSLRLDAAESSAAGTGGATGFWLGGQTQFGNRAADGGLRFRTDGVTLGIDRRFSDSLILGISGGYAKDRTEVGASNSDKPAPSGTRAVGHSLSLYGSYQPGEHLFVETMLGVGRLDLDIDRFVASSGATARGSRQGEQWFGSLAVGYQFRLGAAVVSPFGRLDAVRTRLDTYAETGAGLDSLTYLEQNLPSHQVALGLSAQSRHSADIGWITPRARLEWRHDLRREGSASLFYTDLPGNVYQVAGSGDRRDSMVLGLGTELQLRSGLRLGADFQTQRLGRRDADQTLRLWLAQSLGDPSVPAPSAAGEKWFTDPVRVEAFLTTDDNLNRAGDRLERRTDRSYSLNVSKGTEMRLGSNSRLLASAFGAADKFVRYAGMDRVSLGLQARAEYRASSAFTEPIVGLQARLSYDDHPGTLRTGTQGSVSLTYRQAVTDRIEGFASVARRVRQGESPVFDERDISALVQIDYTISPSIMVYAAAERRKGDLVSTVTQSPAYASFARASAADDAYGAPALFAYRYEANTTVWTLGFNRPIGPRDAIDISLRRASSTPTAPPSPLYGDPPSYATTQFSLAYLLRF